MQPDHLGTPRVVIDPVRDVAIWQWNNKSEVFGDQAPANDSDGDGVALDLALSFPGQQATDASGLFYNYQREYDPAVGRYSQSDPIGLRGGITLFSYSKSNPASRADPLGLRSTAGQVARFPPPGGYYGDGDYYQQQDPDLPNYGISDYPRIQINTDRIAKSLLADVLVAASRARLDLVLPWLSLSEKKGETDCPVPGQRGLPGEGSQIHGPIIQQANSHATMEKTDVRNLTSIAVTITVREILILTSGRMGFESLLCL